MEAPILFQAAALGIIQGASEFLPISSSAHLVVIPKVLGWPYLGKSFDVALHAGTLLALSTHFYNDLRDLGRGLQLQLAINRRPSPSWRLIKQLVLASIPVALVGFLIDPWLESYLQSLTLIACLSLIWGGVLGWADSKLSFNTAKAPVLTMGQAFIMGCFQALAVIPGTSRSGATMTAATLMGIPRSVGARFSYLLSIPVILGATIFKGWPTNMNLLLKDLPIYVIGMVSAAITGRYCLKFFLNYLERGSFRACATYRILFGAAILAWITLSRP